MKRIRVAVLVVVALISLSVAAVTPLQALPSLGQHRVLPGESLYCIGRGYGVAPWAIAQANGLAVLAHVFVGQVLTIPAVTWSNIPPGPVCAPQFVPAGLATVAVTPVVCGSSLYLIQRGDTLWRIALRNGVTVEALRAANNLQSNLIFAGQPLVIPSTCGLSATPTPSALPNTSGDSGGSGNPTATLAPPTPTSPPTATNPSGPSATPSNTLPPTASNTAGPSPTASNTPTITNTPTQTNTPTITNTPTRTNTPTPTNTLAPPSETPPATDYPG